MHIQSSLAAARRTVTRPPAAGGAPTGEVHAEKRNDSA
jgi:hypothetical protein